MGVALHFNKFESHSSKDDLYQVWLKLAQWFWKTRFLKFCPLFSQFRNNLPLEQGGALHLNYKFNPLHPRMLAPSLPEIDPVFDLEEKILKILSIIFAISQ